MAARFVLLKTHLVFALILIIATLNRNSSIILVVLYGLATVRRWRDMLPVLVYGSLWGAVYGYLFLTRHPAYEMVTIQSVLDMNLSSDLITQTIPNNLALLPLFVLMLAGWRLNPFLKRISWAAFFYIPPLLVAALYWETRLWLPLMAALLPMALQYLERVQIKSPGV